MQSNKKEILTITLKLLVICSIVAVIIAFVNTITKDRIAYNKKQSTADALSKIYSENYDNKKFTVSDDEFIIEGHVKCSSIDYDYKNEDITAIYALTGEKSGKIEGYCVSISPMGFKAEIQMLVAVNSDMTVKGVKIVDISDTKGLGDKVKDENWLSNFIGKSSKEALEVDTISGSTKSSKPVIKAVSDAVEEVASYVKKNGGAVK